MALIRTLTISTTAFERMKEKFYGFRQTESGHKINPQYLISQGMDYSVVSQFLLCFLELHNMYFY